MRNPWEEKKTKTLSSSYTANVDRNRRSQALNDSLRWHPALAYQIKLTPSCPWVRGKGRHVNIFHARKRREPGRGWHASITPFPCKDISEPLGCCKTAKPSWHQIRRRGEKENNVCTVCRVFFPSVFIKMKMRRFIRLPVKKTRSHPGNTQCESIQYLTPIQMTILDYEQCITLDTTCHNLTVEYYKVCLRWKNLHSWCLIPLAASENSLILLCSLLWIYLSFVLLEYNPDIASH